MIVRRILSDFCKQDWIARAIDLMIVVFGVFLGIQAANWNDSRLDRKLEDQLLARLFTESEIALKIIVQEKTKVEKWLQAQRALLNFITSEKINIEAGNLESRGFETLSFYPAVAPVRTAYDEIKASGRIQLIRDQEVREAIASYYADLEWFNMQLNYFRQYTIVAEADPRIVGRQYLRSRFDPSAANGRRYEFDWQNIRSTPELISLIVDKHRNQVAMQANRNRLLISAQSLCNTLADANQSICRATGANLDKDQFNKLSDILASTYSN